MKIQDWELKEGVSDGFGGVKNIYLWKGRTAIRHVLSSYTARHLGGYFLLERDIRNIQTWIAVILRLLDEIGPEAGECSGTQKRQGDPEKNNIVKGLFVGVLAIYGKLYTAAKGRRVSLSSSIITDPKHLENHERLMELRHSFAAHSGEEAHEKCEVVAALVPEKEQLVFNLFTELSQPNHFSKSDFGEIDDLMKFLHTHVLKKRDELWKRVKERDLSQEEVKSLIELYGKSGVLAGHLRNL